MTTRPLNSYVRFRAYPSPQQSSSGNPAAPSTLAIATAVVRRLVREKSSYVVELAGQEARLEKLLLKSNKGEAGTEREEGDEAGDHENREYRVKQEEKALEETRAVFGPLRERILTATEKLEDMVKSEAWKDEKEVQAAKDMIATARQQMTMDTLDGGS